MRLFLITKNGKDDDGDGLGDNEADKCYDVDSGELRMCTLDADNDGFNDDVDQFPNEKPSGMMEIWTVKVTIVDLSKSVKACMEPTLMVYKLNTSTSIPQLHSTRTVRSMIVTMTDVKTCKSRIHRRKSGSNKEGILGLRKIWLHRNL